MGDNETIIFIVCIFGMFACLWIYYQIDSILEWKSFERSMREKEKSWIEKVANTIENELMKDEVLLKRLKEIVEKRTNNDKLNEK